MTAMVAMVAVVSILAMLTVVVLVAMLAMGATVQRCHCCNGKNRCKVFRGGIGYAYEAIVAFSPLRIFTSSHDSSILHLSPPHLFISAAPNYSPSTLLALLTLVALFMSVFLFAMRHIDKGATTRACTTHVRLGAKSLINSSGVGDMKETATESLSVALAQLLH